MVDANYTALHIVLDRSGSMSSIRDDMIGALEHMLKEQASQAGLLTVDVVTFDDELEHTHAWAAPEDVTVELQPRGGTALYDAVGTVINGFDQRIEALPEHARPTNVQVIIVTDGFDNRSTEYNADIVRSLVQRQRDKGWGFVFLGADQDATLAAKGLGIDEASAIAFTRDRQSVVDTMNAASAMLTGTRLPAPQRDARATRDTSTPPSTCIGLTPCSS
ncbi:VWA domain-containing protein [Agrococcus lahaulensis]|nr:VWA domain-containing protein [Agrococcus lahaulensis]